jgi:hypothetical protein
MTVATGTITNVFGFTTPLGPKKNAAGASIVGCYVTATFSGTYAQGDDAQLTTVGATIASFAKDGKTYNALQACFVAPGDEAGTPLGAGACTVSSNTITFPLTGSDMTTEHANAALGSLNHGVCFFVTCAAS